MGGGGSKIGGFNSFLWMALGGAGGTLLAWELRDGRERKLRMKLDNRERIIAVESLTILNTALAQADKALKACTERHDRLLDLVIGRYLHCAELDEALSNARKAEAQAAEYSRHMRILQQRIFNYVLHQDADRLRAPMSEISPATPIDGPAAPSATTTAGISRCVARASVSATRTVLASASGSANRSVGQCGAGRSLRLPLALVPRTINALFRHFFKVFSA